MLLIGSSCRNSGKTELACEIIRRFGATSRIIGVKATVIKSEDEGCPRGNGGCGVCRSLVQPFEITEETCPDSDKDTSRLLQSGASRVFWLRVRQAAIAQGALALKDRLGQDALVVCESNSLRQAVLPDLFLMVQHESNRQWKTSARAVQAFVDDVVVSTGSSFLFQPDRLRVCDGSWRLKREATAIVLAGGESRRMGHDKSLLRVGGLPLIEHIYRQLEGRFSSVLICTNTPQKYAFLGVPVARDGAPGQGPLMGLVSALEASTTELNFVVACDIPTIEPAIVSRLFAAAPGWDIVVPRGAGERLEPLFAVYRKTCVAALRRVLSGGGRRIREAFGLCKVRYLDLSECERLTNLNTPEDWQVYLTSSSYGAGPSRD